METLNWRKSSYSSANGGNCVEVADIDDAMAKPDFKPDAVLAVRDSKNPQGAWLYFNPGEWDAFLKGVKDGEFDGYVGADQG